MTEDNMRKRQGFALVTSLLILLVLSGLGVGAAFLANVNLRVAENTATQAQARFNAQEGIDIAFLLLAREFREERALPSGGSAALDRAAFLNAFPGFETAAYELVGYQVFGPDPDVDDSYETARVQVRGIGARGAEHVAEALIEAVARIVPGGEGYSVFEEGFVSNGDCDIAGRPQIGVNFHCGRDIDIRAGSFVDGAKGTAVGECTGGGVCESGGPAPEVPLPDFDSLRQEIIAYAEEEVLGFDMDTCVAPTGATFSGSNAVLCLEPGQEITITGNVRDLIVIGDETTRVVLDAVAGDPNDTSVNGVTVVSGDIKFHTNLDVPCDSEDDLIWTNAEFHGTNTIVAKEEICFGQNVTSRDFYARTFIVTEDDFTLRGTGARDIIASFWVGGTFRYNGTPNTFKATVVANTTIFGAGAGAFNTIVPPEGLENWLVPRDSSPSFVGAGIRVLGRR